MRGRKAALHLFLPLYLVLRIAQIRGRKEDRRTWSLLCGFLKCQEQNGSGHVVGKSWFVSQGSWRQKGPYGGFSESF
jgi:hypothetical protein